MPAVMRRMAETSFAITAGSKARSVSSSFTSSGMMLRFRPPWIVPTVTTARVPGATSRLTIVCSATTICEARTTGSLAVCGAEPWPLTPRTTMSSELTPDMNGPSR